MDIKPPSDEEALNSAARTLCPEAGDAIETFLAAGALTDAAIAIFREALPKCGFKLVMPPPAPGGDVRHAYASVWPRGEAHAVSHRAATPAMALLRATQAESARRLNAITLADCAVCSGVGWFIASSGVKQTCGHKSRQGSQAY